MKILDFCTTNRIFKIGRNRRNVPLLFCRYSNSSFSKALGLNSSKRVSINSFLFSQKFVKIICCIFDLSFLHSFDEEYAVRLRPLLYIESEVKNSPVKKVLDTAIEIRFFGDIDEKNFLHNGNVIR